MGAVTALRRGDSVSSSTGTVMRRAPKKKASRVAVVVLSWALAAESLAPGGAKTVRGAGRQGGLPLTTTTTTTTSAGAVAPLSMSATVEPTTQTTAAPAEELAPFALTPPAPQPPRRRTTLSKSLKTPDPVPRAGIEAATRVMESGRLFRYNLATADESEVSRCEAELAAYTGHKFALGLNSCGTAIFLSLKCAGARPGDRVLTNGFTFTAVPSAIVHAGCEPVYVECDESLCVDLADLDAKMAANPDAKYFIVSHMRGKIADMDGILELCRRHGVELLEDCAHSLGVLYKDAHTGHHGSIASFSSQSYKMLNSGEGGFFVTDDDHMFAKAMAYAGAYETLADKHLCKPSREALEAAMDGTVPNYSLRMHEATAAMLRPQILTIDARREQYNERYYDVAARLDALPRVSVPRQLPDVTIVGDSIQFHLDLASNGGSDEDDEAAACANAETFLARCAERGLPVERFGSKDNARNFKNWKYAAQPLCGLPRTRAIIAGAFDVRLPLLFDDDDIDKIVYIIEEALDETFSDGHASFA